MKYDNKYYLNMQSIPQIEDKNCKKQPYTGPNYIKMIAIILLCMIMSFVCRKLTRVFLLENPDTITVKAPEDYSVSITKGTSSPDVLITNTVITNY